MKLDISVVSEFREVSTSMDSILTRLREAQSIARDKKESVVSAGLNPKEWLQLVQELRAEGIELEAWDDAKLEYDFNGTRCYVDLERPWLEAFRALFIIRERFNEPFGESEARAAWKLADEALQAFANEFFLSKP